MTPEQLKAVLKKASVTLNNLTLSSIVLNGTISALLNELDTEDWVEANRLQQCTNNMGAALTDFCDTLETFQKLAFLLAGGLDEE